MERNEFKREMEEKRRDYNKQYYNNNRGYFLEYFKEYYKNHKNELDKKNKEWRKSNKGDFVYLHIDEDGKALYIGSTSRPLIERQSAHLTGNSNLNMTIEEYIDKYNFSTILYKDFTKYKLNRCDLYFIEGYFKEKFGEIIKNKVPNPKEEELSLRKDELIKIAEKAKLEEFDIDKYLY